MSFTKLNDNLNIIRSLANRPALEADDLKAEFDKASNIIKDYINEILIEEMEDTFESTKQDILQKVFPIGSRYVTQQNINPNTILGFGTWERFKGKVAIGLDENDTDFNEIGKTGGEKTHSLTIEEMPKHSHYLNGYTDAVGSGDNYYQTVTGSTSYGVGSTNYKGGDQSHNNLQPYEIVGYIWIRRS